MDRASDIRRRSKLMKTAIAWITVSLSILVVLENFGVLLTGPVLRGEPPPAFASLLVAFAQALPAAFYLWGLWSMRAAFERLSGADLFDPHVSVLLERVGGALLGGALASLLVTPNLLRLVGQGPPYLIALDVGAFALGLIGLSLAVLAALLRRARKMQSDLRDII